MCKFIIENIQQIVIDSQLIICLRDIADSSRPCPKTYIVLRHPVTSMDFIEWINFLFSSIWLANNAASDAQEWWKSSDLSFSRPSNSSLVKCSFPRFLNHLFDLFYKGYIIFDSTFSNHTSIILPARSSVGLMHEYTSGPLIARPHYETLPAYSFVKGLLKDLRPGKNAFRHFQTPKILRNAFCMTSITVISCIVLQFSSFGWFLFSNEKPSLWTALKIVLDQGSINHGPMNHRLWLNWIIN